MLNHLKYNRIWILHFGLKAPIFKCENRPYTIPLIKQGDAVFYCWKCATAIILLRLTVYPIIRILELSHIKFKGGINE